MKPMLKKYVNLAQKNQLISGSAVLLVGGLTGNAFNYLYHLLMGRLLGPADYGALESVVSLIYIFGIPMTAINLVIVKKVCNLLGGKKEGVIVSLYRFLRQKLFSFSLIAAFILVVFSPLIQKFLHLESILPVWIVVIQSLISIFISLNISFLKSFLKFFSISLVGVIEAGTKIFFGFILVIAGFAVSGGSGGYLFGAVFGLILSGWQLRKIFRQETGYNTIQVKPAGYLYLFKQAIPFLVLSFSFISLFSTDVILARHFLTPLEAGYYAALSFLGKVTFFAAGPVITTMFPIISTRYTAKESYYRYFFLSMLMVGLICIGIILIYYFFSGIMIRALYGNSYLTAQPYLYIFAIFIGLYTLANLVSQFFLSIGVNRPVWLTLAAAVVQAILIFFHHQSLVEIVMISLWVCGLLLLCLMIYLGASIVKKIRPSL